jgi:membrane associated rhomboid family serine protease
VKNYLLKQAYSTLFYPFLFILVIWIFFIFQNTSSFNFLKLGILPREVSGLPGIVTSVFIHGDIRHILSNTLPLLVLGMMLFYFYKKIAKPVFLWIWLVSGVWLWIGGRNNFSYPTYHIGASTLVYGLASFLFFSGLFRRHIRLMVVSALVVFLYGGIVWGVFPIKEEISWEGHLFGTIAGILVAFNYRKEGPQRRVYQWEEEEEEDTPDHLPEEDPSGNEADQNPQNNEIRINFIYKEKDKETK